MITGVRDPKRHNRFRTGLIRRGKRARGAEVQRFRIVP